MESYIPEPDTTEGAPLKLLRGACNSVLNIGRIANEFVNFDPHPDALSSVKPGLLDAIRQVRQDRQAH